MHSNPSPAGSSQDSQRSEGASSTADEPSVQTGRARGNGFERYGGGAQVMLREPPPLPRRDWRDLFVGWLELVEDCPKLSARARSDHGSHLWWSGIWHGRARTSVESCLTDLIPSADTFRQTFLRNTYSPTSGHPLRQHSSRRRRPLPSNLTRPPSCSPSCRARRQVCKPPSRRSGPRWTAW